MKMYAMTELFSVEMTYKRWADARDHMYRGDRLGAMRSVSGSCFICSNTLDCPRCVLVRSFKRLQRLSRGYYDQPCWRTKVFRTAYEGVFEKKYSQARTITAINRMLKLLNALSERLVQRERGSIFLSDSV